LEGGEELIFLSYVLDYLCGPLFDFGELGVVRALEMF
jgi:hypothetical protein